MRVLLVNTRHYRGGGDSTYTFNVADILRGAGHDVSFFAMADARNLPDPNADLFASAIDFVALNRTKSPAGATRVLRRAIWSSEVREKFARLAERVKPDVVYVQSLHGHLTPSWLPEARRRGIPVLWMLHDYKLACPNTHLLIDRTGELCEACTGGRFYAAPLRRCKKNSLAASGVAALEAYVHRRRGVTEMVDRFVAPSRFLREKLIEMGAVPAARTAHLPYPVMRFAAGASEPGAYLLFAGRLTAIKGILPLLEAARRVPQVRLLLAGRADEDLAARLPSLLPPNAQYLGLQTPGQLEPLLAGAAGAVVPSLWYENQPFAILEAFAAGRPVIASRLGGMAELVGNDERGLLVPAGDVQALGDAMVRLVTDRPLAARLGADALEYARGVHAPARHYDALMTLFHGQGVR